MNKSATITVKKEVRDTLANVVDMLNKKQSGELKLKKVTIAGLVTRLAHAYEDHMDERTMFGNQEDWIDCGAPVILDSDAYKHFAELKNYEPVDCTTMVSMFIRKEAMIRRFDAMMKDKS